MNKKINDLDYNQLIFLDIETVRGSDKFDENHPHYDVWAWKQRDKETNKIPESSVLIQSYNDKAALFAEWGKIVCISVGYIHNDELFITSYSGEEKDILLQYVDMMKKQSRMAVGHNLIPFDNNYIRKRWFINGLGEYLSDKQGNDVYMKPWLLDDALFDTMVAWKGAGYVNTSLDELAMCFNIPSSKNQLHGNEVSDYYYSGKLDEIVSYCEKDVAVVANIVRRWKGDDILEPVVKSKVDIVDERTFLEKLHDSETFTESLQKEFEKSLKGKKLTKKDREGIKDILLSVYQKKGERKAEKTKKEKEIDEYVNSL